jgi:ribose 1,5-bisphosphate isomerase
VTTRPNLTPRAAAQLDAFDAPHILGASRQIEIVADLLIAAAEEHDGDGAALAQRLGDVAAYLSARRGASSQAIPNALALMLDGHQERVREEPDTLREWTIANIRRYRDDAAGWMAAIVANGALLASGAKRLLAYDYSSTIARILCELGAAEEPPLVILPEARTLEGGRRFVEDLQDTPLRFELFPDAAIGSKLRGCDLVLIGAETITAEGGCYNTTGSLLVALACQHWRVPLYVPSTLVKIDARTLSGYRRPDPELGEDHMNRLTEGWPRSLVERVSVASPDLDYVPPALLSGYVTEAGILPPAAIVQHAERLAQAMGGG